MSREDCPSPEVTGLAQQDPSRFHSATFRYEKIKGDKYLVTLRNSALGDKLGCGTATVDSLAIKSKGEKWDNGKGINLKKGLLLFLNGEILNIEILLRGTNRKEERLNMGEEE